MSDPGRLLDEQEQAASVDALRTGLARTGVDVADLRARSLRLDGDVVGPAELVAVLSGDGGVRLTAHQHDVLAQALNDHFTERGQNHPVRYAADLATPRDHS